MRIYLWKKLFLDLIYPNRCGVCGCFIPFDEYFCNTCSKRFTPPPQNVKLPHIDFLTMATSYDSFSKPFITEFKSKNNGYAINGAAFMIYKSLGGEIEFDIITFIPMSRKSIAKRGYNQSRLIANELSWLTDKPVGALLKKVRHTKEQKYLNAKERQENVKDAFVCNKEKAVNGKQVLLIDDVSTTGSTLSEAVKALKNAGAVSVRAAVFAKTKELKI